MPSLSCRSIEPLSLIGTNFLIDHDPAGAAFSPFAKNPALTGFDASTQEVTAVLDDQPMITVRDQAIAFHSTDVQPNVAKCSAQRRSPSAAGQSHRVETDHYTVNVPPLFSLDGRGSEDIP